jgi:hypothetical protein
MKFALAIAMLALGVSAPLTAHEAGTAHPAAVSRLTIDTPIETIVADAAGKAVIDATFPGMTTHPAYDQFKAMSLVAVEPFSQGAITAEGLEKAKAALAAIK